MYTITDLFDMEHTQASEYLSQFTYPWEALKGIKDFILQLGPTLGEEYEEVLEHVWVHKTAKVFPLAYLGAPCIIGPETEVRHCAFIRGSALVGANCVVGNSVELKNVIEPGLIGGVKVALDGKVYDGSLRNRLMGLENTLMKSGGSR